MLKIGVIRALSGPHQHVQPSSEAVTGVTKISSKTKNKSIAVINPAGDL